MSDDGIEKCVLCGESEVAICCSGCVRAAQKRIEELTAEAAEIRAAWQRQVEGQQQANEREQHALKALVAQHPEQLRRVAEAVYAQCWPDGVPFALDLERIIAEATKPPTS